MKKFFDLILAIPFTLLSIPIMIAAFAMKAIVPQQKSKGQVIRMTPYSPLRNAG